MAKQKSQWSDIATTCGVPVSDIEDVYPCTPFQIDAMVGSSKHPSTHVYRGSFVLDNKTVDVGRYCAAVDRVTGENAILRTRIVDDCTLGFVQAVLVQRGPVVLEDAQDHADDDMTMGLGSSLIRWRLRNGRLILTCHHALHDQTSIWTLGEDVLRVYHGMKPPPHAPFREYVEYIQAIDQQAATQFWKDRFPCAAEIYPQVDVTQSPLAASHTSHIIPLSASTQGRVSLAQIPAYIEAAWALVASAMSGSEVVAYGFALSGRTGKLGSVASTLGPVMTTTPVQVDVRPELSVQKLVQQRARDRRQLVANAALHWGSSNIRSVNENAKVACQFQTLLNIIPPTRDRASVENQCVGEEQGPITRALCLWFQISGDRVSIEAAYDASILPESQVRRNLHHFAHFLGLLLDSPPERTVGDLPRSTPQDVAQIMDWNSSLPTDGSWEHCLHHLFSTRAGQRPQAIAVEAWDGKATYAELDCMSSHLAHSLLVSGGLSKGDPVVLLLDRSLAAIVSALAVLKSGGCCVPVDTKFPSMRQKAIISATGARHIITLDSTYLNSFTTGEAIQVWTVNSDELARFSLMDDLPSTFQFPSTTGADLAYILFTSGSTGIPKGVMLEHGNLTTSIQHNGETFSFGSSSRCLQFASLVWDVSLLEIYGALLFGGCVCVPCEMDRESGLALYMTSHSVDFTCLTPAVLRSLKPPEIPTISTICTTGECIDPDAVQIWGDVAQLFNAWAPSECSILSACGRVTASSPYPETIGFPKGCSIWIVDPRHGNQLAPIGAMGLLMIEGNTVARGYLNEPVLTARSFIEPPTWAPERCSPDGSQNRTRFFLSGDLARYNPDGSICFIGRVDNQVKIRGQRFELEEVDSVISAHESVRNVSAVVCRSDAEQTKKLVAVITLSDPSLPRGPELRQITSSAHAKTVQRHLIALQASMNAVLPSFMIPSAWLVVEGLPRTISAKVDRSEVAKWVASLETITSVTKTVSVTPPSTSAEKELQTVWSTVLAVPESTIGRETSFVGLGGDSITAMQVATRYRRAGYRTTIASLLNSADLATVAQQSHRAVEYTSDDTQSLLDVGGYVPLTPVQHFFTANNGPAASNYFNQSWLLDFRADSDAAVLEHALRRLVSHHPMLRARFSQQCEDGASKREFVQRIAPDTSDSLRFSHHTHILKETDLHHLAHQSETSLDLANGPLFAADLIEMQDGRRFLFMTAHHLVIDLVSWRIIWDDLGTLLREPEATLARTLPFTSWTQHQLDKCRSRSETQPSLVKQQVQWPRADRDFWGMSDKIALAQDVVSERFSLEVETTELLMGSSNTAYRTAPVELLLSAILLSFRQSFCDRKAPAFYVETHGRQACNAEDELLDTSRTVGWFTTLLPIHALVNHESPVDDVVVAVKDSYRRASVHAVQSFADEVLGSDDRLNSSNFQHRHVELMFNFIGGLQQVDTSNGVLDISPSMPSFSGLKTAGNCEQTSLINIGAAVLGGRLQFWVEWNSSMLHQDRLRGWTTRLQALLQSMPHSLVGQESRLTLSDMPLLDTDGSDTRAINQHLTSLGISPSHVSSIMPCSPVQEGILYAQVRAGTDSMCYWSRIDMKITPASGVEGDVDVARLAKAWHSVCEAHPILRTVLVSGLVANTSFQQVVLKQASPSLSLSSRLPSTLSSSSPRISLPDAFDGTVSPHHLVIDQSAGQRSVHVSLYISHVLIDGGTIPLLARQLSLAYTQDTKIVGSHGFDSYLQWIRQHSEESQKYWLRRLTGIHPCVMPTLSGPRSDDTPPCYIDGNFSDMSAVHSLCQRYGVTVANIMQVAWAIVLRRYTGSSDVCFGCMMSNRDVINGGEDIVGPLITMIPMRFDMGPSNTAVASLLSDAKENFAQSLEHAACSLTAIQDALGMGSTPIFNTIMSIQALVPEGLSLDGSSIHVELLDVLDPSEYPFVLGVMYDKGIIKYRLTYQPQQVPQILASQVMDMLQNTLRIMVHEASATALSVALRAKVEAGSELRPFETLVVPDPKLTAKTRLQAASQCELPGSAVEDVFPCTMLQQERMEASVLGQVDAMVQHVVTSKNGESCEQLREAFERAVQAIPALRTRIVKLPKQGCFQVVTKSQSWSFAETLEEYLEWVQSIPVRYGGWLCRLGAVEDDNGRGSVILSLHPAICDEWTFQQCLDHVGRALQQVPFPSPLQSLSPFVHDFAQTHLYHDSACKRWNERLRGSHLASTFPPLPPTSDRVAPMPDHSPSATLLVSAVTQKTPDFAAVLTAAWALCLYRLTGNIKVLIGVQVDGRDVHHALLASDQRMDQVTGPLDPTVPYVIDVDPTASCKKLVSTVLDYSAAMPLCAHAGKVDSMVKIDDDSRAACNLTNNLAVHVADKQSGLFDVRRITGLRDPASTIQLTVDCSVTDDGTRVTMTYMGQDPRLDTLQHVLHQYGHALSQIANDALPGPISQLSPISEYDLSFLRDSNALTPVAVDSCLHSLVRERCRSQPDCPAVCSWDAELSYAELEELSNRLANRLQNEFFVQPEQIIAFLLPRSAACIVTMLAILKAGGVMLGLEANQPDDRLKDILVDSEASLILTSTAGGLDTRLRRFCPPSTSIVAINLDDIKSLAPQPIQNSPVKPSNAAYAVYTSGSTGIPKGIIVRHSDVATSLAYHIEPLGMNADTRVLHITSYAFDVSIIEIFQPLLAGACVCVPSDHDRMSEIEKAIVDRRANFVWMTPSLASVLSPSLTANLQTVVLTGEPMTAPAIDRWMGKVRLLGAYGPSETGFSSCVDITRDQLSNIGKPSGCHFWVVDEQDSEQLVPIGCPGELLIQGPIVSRGYLKRPEQTAAAFLTCAPAWTKDFPRLDKSLPFYKTGDIVVQCPDGSFIHRQRKDRQVKLRGQRVELGEIESHISRFVGDTWRVAVEPIRAADAPDDLLLAAFLSPIGSEKDTHSTHGHMLLPEVPDIAFSTHQAVLSALPPYMVPAVYLAVRQWPLNSSGKTDRMQLRGIGSSLTALQLRSYIPVHSGLKRTELVSKQDSPDRSEEQVEAAVSPANERERLLLQLWSLILSLPEASIDRSSDWVGSGGNSLKAIRLVGAAREKGFRLSVVDVFQSASLEHMATLLMPLADLQQSEMNGNGEKPFSLLAIDVDAAVDQAAHLCGLDRSAVEDIYPCTALQEGLLVLSSRRPGDCVLNIRLELESSVDLDRLRYAWRSLVRMAPSLRSRIVNIPGQGMVQVILGDDGAAPITSFGKTIEPTAMGLGTVLSSVLIDQTGDNEKYLTWTVHHAIYDGWSQNLLMQALENLYNGNGDRANKPLFTPFRKFVEHSMSVSRGQAATEYWKSQFIDLDATAFPSLPSSGYKPRANTEAHLTISGLEKPARGVTLPIAIRAAWAVLLAAYAGSEETVVNVVNDGRSANIPGIEHMVGPTLATVPVRISVPADMSVADLLRNVQEQSLGMIPWEATGVQNIRKASPEADVACNFPTLLLVQPSLAMRPLGSSHNSLVRSFTAEQVLAREGYLAFSEHAIILECGPEEESQKLHLKFSFDSNVLTRDRINRMAQQLEQILRDICHEMNRTDTETPRTLAEIKQAKGRDLTDICRWNATVPTSVDACLPEVLAASFLQHGESTAICAWDGTLTYHELQSLAMKLSSRLKHDYQVGTEVRVPLLFEKSMWTSVAMLAVIMAGGIAVLLDASQPLDRLRSTVQQVKPAVLLTSPSQEHLAKAIGQVPILAINGSLFDDQRQFVQSTDATGGRSLRPSNAVYISFTSGSTGTPKGIVITHANICSALKYHAGHLGLSSRSRVFDFSSYAWDMSWYNLLHTLQAGACLCVPSEEERQNNPSGSIVRFEADWIATTATVASLLNEQALEQLQQIELVGEIPSTGLMERLRQSGCQCRNIFGPTECTIIASVSQDMRHPSHIGTGAGSVLWIVNADNPSYLVPVGCVGELWFEGPLVGRGYEGDPKQTAAVFFQNVPFCERSGQFYRTGDLVRYEEDGSLMFLGRSDNQVKVRGQRLELGEVEQHVQRILNNTKRAAYAVAETLVVPGHGSGPILALGLIPEGAAAMTDPELRARVAETVDGLDQCLADVVPAFMVPSLYTPLRDIPLMLTGKKDRHRLRRLMLSEEPIGAEQLRGNGDDSKIAQPSNMVEASLQEIWGKVLTRAPSSISLDARWGELGDSITAMHAIAHARKQKLDLRMDDILRLQTIRRIAEMMEKRIKSVEFVEATPIPRVEIGTRVGLSPVQEWYFQYHGPPKTTFDISVCLRFNEKISPDKIHDALRTIVARHDMLRARFEWSEQDQSWFQYIDDSVETSHHFEALPGVAEEDFGPLIRSGRNRLDMERGPILSAALLGDQTQTLSLSIHHLVCDYMSWRVIAQDVESLLATGHLLPLQSTGFLDWTVAQREFASTNLPPETALSTYEQLIPPQWASWGLDGSHIKSMPVTEVSITLNSLESAHLLNPSSYHAPVLDRIIGALLHAFSIAFPQRADSLPPCYCIGHGREPGDGSVGDVMQTVGWFSTIYPVQISGSGESRSLATTVDQTADARQRLRRNGSSYFLSRFANPRSRETFEKGACELLLNFLGDSLKTIEGERGNGDGVLSFVPLPKEAEVEYAWKPPAVLEINGRTDNGELHFLVKYVCGDEEAERFVRCFRDALLALGKAGVEDE